MIEKTRSKLNRSIVLDDAEIKRYLRETVTLKEKTPPGKLLNKTIRQDLFEAIQFLPDAFVDLMIIDPPYNLDKSFNGKKFKKQSIEEYEKWIESFLEPLTRCLKPDASIYFCGDWQSSTSIHLALEKYFKVRNRITWEREKGRGAKTNWKNNSEDIWFATVSNEYVFNVDDVKMKRRVIAPYKDEKGAPKDWSDGEKGKFRLTHPANVFTDISVPFWSMSENTEHPTQKPEKLIAKLILASSNKGDVVFDPFLGSGTTSVVAKKLVRKFVGIEADERYAAIAEKRLELAETDKSIQGYSDGVFWERNTPGNLKIK
ncbi:MAG: site-specific DNA-methyltransferase [Chlorobi bacterium]|nr:site-specific DNA-methyltransferase [Chlorobiota bacterium]